MFRTTLLSYHPMWLSLCCSLGFLIGCSPFSSSSSTKNENNLFDDFDFSKMSIENNPFGIQRGMPESEVTQKMPDDGGVLPESGSSHSFRRFYTYPYRDSFVTITLDFERSKEGPDLFELSDIGAHIR